MTEGIVAALFADSGVELVPRLGPAVARYPAGSTFGPRDAVSYQFVWIVRGGAAWTNGDAEVVLGPGTLLLVRPGMRDRFQWSEHEPTEHAYVHFRLGGFRGHVDDGAWPLIREMRIGAGPLAALCDHLLALAAARHDGWEHQTCETLRLLLTAFVIDPPSSSECDDRLDPTIVAAMDEVRREWADGIARAVPLGTLATAAGTSISTLCRAFRRHIHLGPVTTIERLRLDRAESLLWLSNLSMEAIAHQCGFYDAYHFSRRFRAVYGVAPSTFRATEPGLAPPSPIDRDRLAPLAALIRVRDMRSR